MRELIQGRAIEELDKLKMRLCLTPEELKIFNKRKKKKENKKMRKRKCNYEEICRWAIKYRSFQFSKAYEYAPKTELKSYSLNTYFYEIKKYIEDKRPIKSKPLLECLLKCLNENIQPAEIKENDDSTKLPDEVKALKDENSRLKERIRELEKSPPIDLKEIKRRLQNEIDSLYYKLQAIELLESEFCECEANITSSKKGN